MLVTSSQFRTYWFKGRPNFTSAKHEGQRCWSFRAHWIGFDREDDSGPCSTALSSCDGTLLFNWAPAGSHPVVFLTASSPSDGSLLSSDRGSCPSEFLILWTFWSADCRASSILSVSRRLRLSYHCTAWPSPLRNASWTTSPCGLLTRQLRGRTTSKPLRYCVWIPVLYRTTLKQKRECWSHCKSVQTKQCIGWVGRLIQPHVADSVRSGRDCLWQGFERGLDIDKPQHQRFQSLSNNRHTFRMDNRKQQRLTIQEQTKDRPPPHHTQSLLFAMRPHDRILQWSQFLPFGSCHVRYEGINQTNDQLLPMMVKFLCSWVWKEAASHFAIWAWWMWIWHVRNVLVIVNLHCIRSEIFPCCGLVFRGSTDFRKLGRGQPWGLESWYSLLSGLNLQVFGFSFDHVFE